MNKTKVAAGRTRKANRRRRNGTNGQRGNGASANGERFRGAVRKNWRDPRNELYPAIQRYVDLYEFAPIAYVTFDRSGRVHDVNLAATDLLDRKREYLVRSPFSVCVPPANLDLFLHHVARCRAGERKVETNLRLKKHNGEQLSVILSSTPTTSLVADGAQLFQTAIVDLTEREQTRARLAEQTRLLDLSNDAILVRDSRDCIVYWNHGASEIYGYTAEEAFGKVAHELLRTEHPEPRKRILQKLRRDGRWSGELVHTRKDCVKITVMSRWSLDRDPEGKSASVLETNTDITARKHAEIALERSRELLEELVQKRTQALRSANVELESEIRRRKGLEGQILEISDREQERLGQELHDGLCQQLTAIGFLARATALRLKDHRVVQTEDLEKIARLVNSSVMDARNIARDLHKEEIEAAEFLPALEDLVGRKIWRTPCQLDLKTAVNIEDDRVASQLYRILREALINANKHARATQVVLKVRRLKNEIAFSVTDNGVGLSRKPKAGQGLGFHIMRYRAQTIGARLEFESPKKGGARVACYLPLSVIE